MATATLIGLRSGKEFLVHPLSYVFPDIGKHIFTSYEGKRIYTVLDEDIEFVDEEATEERVEALNKLATTEIKTEVVVTDDPSYI